MFDTSRELTSEEIRLVLDSELTVPQLRDFWGRFPDQELDTAIGGCKMELAQKLEVEKQSSKLPGEDFPKE